MKKIVYNILILTLVACFQSCDESIVEEVEYVTFGASQYSTGVDVGGSTSFDIPVYTTNLSSSDRTYNITVDESSNAAAGSYTVPSSVTIPAGANEAMLTIALTDTNLGIGVNNLVINFANSEGYFTGESTTLGYIQNCEEVTATLDIVFDGYGSETGWEITDALDGVVASGGNYADGQVSASETITLCGGRDYTFTITDAYGDGLSFPNNGTYTLTIGGSVKASGGGDFGSSESTEFNTN
ncbi:hypothetical protein CLV33_11257 [Jejuia pallidilutea]|uniref:Calx-beta domain-containing protein n=1 Tax=Jejuia pallidilutea TaxID=504487 RepID=A0A362WXE3_9FLAO|nr:DUF1735 domain-containing protein [Jejuia pallidilutea]PQV45713.1 hypothetical protein CLV33_11257 [Jejuia pallidilutea]